MSVNLIPVVTMGSVWTVKINTTASVQMDLTERAAKMTSMIVRLITVYMVAVRTEWTILHVSVNRDTQAKHV